MSKSPSTPEEVEAILDQARKACPNTATMDDFFVLCRENEIHLSVVDAAIICLWADRRIEEEVAETEKAAGRAVADAYGEGMRQGDRDARNRNDWDNTWR